MSESNASQPFVIPSRVRTPWSQRVSRFVRGPVQVVAWLGLGAAGVWLTLSESASMEIVGIAVSEAHPVRSQRSALVEEVHVEAGDLVEAGTVVATLGSLGHELEVELARQQLAALSAEIAATVANQRVASADRVLEAQRLQIQFADSDTRHAADEAASRERRQDRAARLAIESRRLVLSLAVMEAEQLGRQVALKRARQVAERAKQLAGGGVGRVANAKDRSLDADELKALVDASALSIEQAEEQLARSRDQLAQVTGSLSQAEDPPGSDPGADERWSTNYGLLEQAAADADLAVLEALERRLDVARAELGRVSSQASAFEVKAPVAGRVTGVAVAAGSVVIGGETLAKIEPVHAKELQIFLPERSAQISTPQEFMVARMAEPLLSSRSAVLRVSDRVTQLPDALQRDPARVVRGRAIFLGIPEGLSILPGERVLATPFTAAP